MGSSLSDIQERALAGFSQIVIMLDGDEAGGEATRQIVARLAQRRSAVADEASPASSEAGAECEILPISESEPGDGSGLPVQAEPLLPAFEQRLNQNKCRELAPQLLRMIALLREQPLPQMVPLGNTLHSWREEIATMWRFTRNHGITEGFHTKMEVLQRQAYGFRNFNNYRLRIKVMCS